MRLGVAKVESIHHHTDISGILARLTHMRDLDQLERSLVHSRLELAIAIPVAVCLLHHDAALEQQPLEHFLDVETRELGIAHAKRDVLEVAEERHVCDVSSDQKLTPGLVATARFSLVAVT